ncbi:hypothetical protein JTB14_017285 [Gonioctena quinquepunctata]|nr:hypothetical protein JTB14_017285 [Gonioctena quinquepunctata]
MILKQKDAVINELRDKIRIMSNQIDLMNKMSDINCEHSKVNDKNGAPRQKPAPAKTVNKNVPNTEPDLSSQKRDESQESTNIVSKQRTDFVSKTEVSAAVMQSEHQMKLDTYIHMVNDDNVQNAAGSNQREWTEAETAGDHYIQLDDPTQCFNGSVLPRRLWSKLNRVRTGCGKCADSLHKWGRAESPQCDCGSPRQTIRHIISECPNRSYDYDFEDFMEATPEAIEWLRNLDVDI